MFWEKFGLISYFVCLVTIGRLFIIFCLILTCWPHNITFLLGLPFLCIYTEQAFSKPKATLAQINSCMKDISLWFAQKIKWFLVYFCWDIAESPCSCIGTLTTIGQEGAPQVGILLPISLGLIFGCNPYTRICIRISRIINREIIT